MDLAPTTAPSSDQLNADDLIAGPVTVTITAVTAGSSEQPVNIEVAEYPGRPWRPSKSMRRVLVAAWGRDSAGYVGRHLTLYRDPDVTFGREKVGGIRVSHMEGLDGPLTVPLTVKRGRRAPYTVQPLAAPPAAGPSLEDVARAGDEETLRAMWQATSRPDIRQAITARVQALRTAAPADVDVEDTTVDAMDGAEIIGEETVA